MESACKVGAIPNTGKENPTIEKAIIPNRQAELYPKRKVGNTPIMKIPTACEAITSRNRADSIGNQPLFNGNELNPYKATAYRNATIVKITV